MTTFDRPDRLSGEYYRTCPACSSTVSMAAKFCPECGRSFADTGLSGDRDE